VFGSQLVSSAAMYLVGIFFVYILSELSPGCCMPAVLTIAVSVSIYSLLVESWILYAELCYDAGNVLTSVQGGIYWKFSSHWKYKMNKL